MSEGSGATALVARDQEVLLRASSLRKTYVIGKRSLEVLRGIDLSVDPGEFLVLCGASGAGKSTLLHLLGGLDVPNAGDIHFRGKSLRQLSNGGLTEFRNRHVGFVFQAYHLLPEFSALENVCLPARMARVPSRDAEPRGRQLLERVGLGERLEHRPYELSGGEQQRVAIARALINDPELILADEPTGNLDSRTGAEIIDLLRALQQEHGRTLIIATHDAAVAAKAPRVVELADGQIRA
jgi:lipoprotein-releasing system ATP-binding protein